MPVGELREPPDGRRRLFGCPIAYEARDGKRQRVEYFSPRNHDNPALHFLNLLNGERHVLFVVTCHNDVVRVVGNRRGDRATSEPIGGIKKTRADAARAPVPFDDRKSAAFLGVYECGIHEFITNYIVPQDNANRCDTRWFMLGDSERWKIQVKGLQPLCFRIWPYGEEDLEGKEHAHELPERDFINLNIDSNIHGVGGNDGWGAQTMKPYTIDGNRSYRYGFIMEYMDKTE